MPCSCNRSGCPAIEVSMEEVEYFRSLHFSWTKIAELMNISRSTLYRRLDEGVDHQLSTYSDISDRDLDEVIRSIKQSHPNDGERLLIGHLHRLDIKVPCVRVRAAAIHRTDHANTVARRSRVVRRRTYAVEGPPFGILMETTNG